jgi:hypothetical protein
MFCFSNNNLKEMEIGYFLNVMKVVNSNFFFLVLRLSRPISTLKESFLTNSRETFSMRNFYSCEHARRR